MYFSELRKERKIKNEIGIEIEDSSQSADIFNKLRVRKDKVPVRPLIEGKVRLDALSLKLDISYLYLAHLS